MHTWEREKEEDGGVGGRGEEGGGEEGGGTKQIVMNISIF